MMKSHGLMFHHFHDEGTIHIRQQGSISAEEFDDILEYYEGNGYTILPASDYADRVRKGSLKDSDVCLTFDDGLLCQYDVAYPVMKDRGLTGFWFVYTSPWDGAADKLEVYRRFRCTEFDDIDCFYHEFFDIVSIEKPDAYGQMKDMKVDEYLSEFPFYTDNDRRYRFLRDVALVGNEYDEIMSKMMETKGFDGKALSDVLWMSPIHVTELSADGNVIGLHSYSHPTTLIKLGYEGQRVEYQKNKEMIEKQIGKSVTTVSYPSSSFDRDTIDIMKSMGVDVGFVTTMSHVAQYDEGLEIARDDHANILKRLKEKS